MSTLNPYFYAYNPQLLAFENAWVQFLKEGRIPDTVISQEIKESWIRCKKMKIDPLTRNPISLLPKEELQKRLEENSGLLSIVEPFLSMLFDIVKETEFRVDFIDRDGYILKSMTTESLEALCHKTLSHPGACRSEEIAGTNAFTLALKTKFPIQVSGAEHYMQQFHRWSCSAAPILDKNGNVLGAISTAGHYEQVHRHTLGMVTAVAQAIQDELYIQQINEQLTQNNRQLNTIFSMITDGLIYTIGGKVIQVNKEMCTFLGIKEQDILGRKIEEVIFTTPKITKLLQDKRPDNQNRQIVLEGNGRICNCLFDVKRLSEGDGAGAEEMMIFTQVEEIQMLAQKISNSAQYNFSDIIGNSQSLRDTIDMAKRAALFNSRIILEGESGTGKEMLAQAIHNYSSRRHNPFVAVDCGAIPKELFESELFGYERGAFTGAREEGKIGLIELADKGTLFLDEIGNMPLEMQVKLLRTLQEGVITKIGGTEQIEIDIRIIAATNTDLQAAVEEGTFRRDLFYRLNVFHIMMPALRERHEDIPLLARHFAEQSRGKKQAISIDKEAMNVLVSYNWPGNIRELGNIIERAVIMSDGKTIARKDLPLEIQENSDNFYRTQPGGLTLQQASQNYILHVVEQCGGNISKAARILDVSRTTVYKAMDQNRNTGG